MANALVKQGVASLILMTASIAFGHGHDHAYDAHVHGVAEMEVVQEGKGLYINLQSPLFNILGFEHAPKTDSEKVKARRVTSLLKANGLFAFSPEAECKRTGYTLHSDVLNPHALEVHKGQHKHGSKEGHSDLRAEYEFECANPDKLKIIEVRVFRQFSGFEKIEVQAVFPSGQVGASLSPDKNRLVVRQ